MEEAMSQRHMMASTTVALWCLGFVWPATAQSLKEQIVDTWTMVSTKNKFPDGRIEDAQGPNPRGILMFDANGRFAFMNMRATLPKFTSNNRMAASAEEYKAVVQGSIAYFGTYMVNEADRTIVTHVVASTFPNFDGGDQKRSILSVTADELKYVNPVASAGAGVVVEATWKRAR
jgi:Lipocalin-like domain